MLGRETERLSPRRKLRAKGVHVALREAKRGCNSHENKSGLIQAVLHTASKRIKLESPGCPGFIKLGKFASKPDQPALYSSIRLVGVYLP